MISSFFTWVLGLPLYLQITSASITGLVLLFIFFLFHAVVLWLRFWKLDHRLRADDGEPREVCETVFSRDRVFKRLWEKYAQSLQPIKEQRAGVSRVQSWRATAPAETYFDPEHVFEGRLWTDFFRHFPGLFTGIGIIGTFAGLIAGLRDFKPSLDTEETVGMIGPLTHAVYEAFMISLTAIAIAMAVTLLEKMVLAGLRARTEKIASAVDAKFAAGIEGEYLSRLVAASEGSATQAKQLKDALVKDLGDILKEVSQAQISAFGEAQQAVGQSIAKDIRSGLTEPLQQMQETFKSVTGGTGERTVRMLQDIMADFGAKLNELLGEQIRGINSKSEQTASAMQYAVTKMSEVVTTLQEQNETTTERTSNQLAESIRLIEERQRQMSNETATATRQLTEQMQAVVTGLTRAQTESIEQNRTREAEMVTRVSSTVNALGENTQAVLDKIGEATTAIARSVEQLSANTADTAIKLDAGAQSVLEASARFQAATGAVAETMQRTVDLGTRLSELTRHMQTGATSLQGAIEDYRSQREAMTAVMGEARSLMETAGAEARLSKTVLESIETSTTRFVGTQRDFDEYLEHVNEVLAKSMSAFQRQLTLALKEANNGFHDEMDKAVKLLSGSIQDLDDVVSGIEA